MSTKKEFCEYTKGVPVLVGEERTRVTTIGKEELTLLARSRGGYMEARDAILLEEGAKMRKSCCTLFTTYPPCEISGVSTFIEARVDERTKMVTAYFVCAHCNKSDS